MDEEKFKNSCKIYDQCHIQCDDENLNRVLNVPNFEKNEVFEYPNFWFIFYAWIIGATACNGVAALQDAIGIVYNKILIINYQIIIMNYIIIITI